MMHRPPDLVEGFAVLSLNTIEMYLYSPEWNQYRLKTLLMEQAYNHGPAPPLCAMSALADYKNAFFKQGNPRSELAAQAEENDIEVTDIDHSLKHLILTGHDDGKVLVWRLTSFINSLRQYDSAVNVLSKCFEGIAIGTKNGLIAIWDVNLLGEQRKINITALDFRVLSSVLVSMDYNQRRILVLTINGDVIEIALDDKREAGPSERAHRVPSVARLTCQTLKALTILR